MKHPTWLDRVGDRLMDLVYFLLEVRDRPWRKK